MATKQMIKLADARSTIFAIYPAQASYLFGIFLESGEKYIYARNKKLHAYLVDGSILWCKNVNFLRLDRSHISVNICIDNKSVSKQLTIPILFPSSA